MKTLKRTLWVMLAVVVTVFSYLTFGFCGGEIVAESMGLDSDEE